MTIFWSAFLLFQIQLVIARYILPWFGGSAAVWMVSMLFFQILLLTGYCYAHWLIEKIRSPLKQATIHLSVIVLAVGVIAWQSIGWGGPILPATQWRPMTDTFPILNILKILGISVG
ncbi:MAG: hypothetical protein OEL75_03880, partial [Kiritimatiellaceae bacterium]|nr:hypothetical protein [Kiritimatiellaceae bacterium]